MKRPCLNCGAPAEASRCNTCSTRKARGYGPAHRKLRAAWKPRVATGTTTCPRCNQPIQPDQPWDLGHTDDRQSWTGPEHTNCNRTAPNRTRGRPDAN